jgi:choline-sulfatase
MVESTDSKENKISRKEFTKRLAGGLGGAALYSSLPRTVYSTESRDKDRRPNIVFICVEQYCFKYTGYSGHRWVHTPNLDRIASRGVTFSNAYTTAPVCAPARAGLMTGMFPSDNNSFGNTTVWDGSNPTWGTRLQEVGYQTWATGKLDLNPAYDLGFVLDYVQNGNATLKGADITELFRRPLIYRMKERPHVNGRAREHRYSHDVKACNKALKHLRSKRKTDKPWATYIGYHLAHPPFVALDKYYHFYYPDRVDMPNILPGHLEKQHLMFQRLRCFKRLAMPIFPEERIRKARAGYFGMITELDEYIGQIWDQLEKTGQLSNTIFVFTADHGEMLGDHGLWYKNNLYDEATHVPLLIAGAGLPEGKQIDTTVSHMDLTYTLLEWTGAKRPDSLRGHSLTSMIYGKGLGKHPGYAYCESQGAGNCTGSFMIRKGDWKYLNFTWYDDLLFNLSDDPGEFTNRIDDPSTKDVLNELKNILHALMNPEKITKKAFRTQKKVLDKMIHNMNADELYDELKGRLGDGQAKVLVDKFKSKPR